MANLVEKRSYTPQQFYAGEFPVVTETGTAGAKIKQYDMIMLVVEEEKDESGAVTATTSALAPATAEGIANVVGIAVTAAAKDEPVVYIMTGEVFADAVNMAEDIDADVAKAALRKLSIFLR